MRNQYTIFGISLTIIFVIAMLAWAEQRRRAQTVIHPLKITIIDTGGAHLKVESTVNPDYVEKTPK
jgi:hypothetical protein